MTVVGRDDKNERFVGWALPTVFPVFMRLCWWAEPTLLNTLKHRHSGMFLAGLNLPGADLNSLWLVRRMKYTDVFHNPVT